MRSDCGLKNTTYKDTCSSIRPARSVSWYQLLPGRSPLSLRARVPDLAMRFAKYSSQNNVLKTLLHLFSKDGAKELNDANTT